ncbi:acyl-CoA thioester hydrolase [Gillisia mitskevichiae]|uniref:Acyl-CoA thioester hydrolase n=1 Tax=Gillisia mitskevichiae TaxID=270921 RepID=A0A495PTS4_9FLAO|nr:thioesterase family protein [Gillisia mitskevichiae]RKS53155.1 acyl-CoA thioester hydrolase [Gillisia mitskevichiae]
MSPTTLKSRIQLKVRFNECDPLQIVWHGNYLKYFEDGREALCIKHGISYLDMKQHGFATPIVKSSCEHKLPLQYGDTFEVETCFQPADSAKLVFTYKIFKGDKLVCVGETTQVFLNESKELVLINPPFFLDWKKKMGLI